MSLLMRLVCLVRGHRWGTPRRIVHQDARLGGVLEHPGKLSPEAVQRLKADWQAMHALWRRAEVARIVICLRRGEVAREP